MTPRPIHAPRGNVLPFRHRGAAVRFRRRPLITRYGRPVAGAALVLGVPIAIALWLVSTPRLALAAVTVVSEPSLLGIVIHRPHQRPPLSVRRVSNAWVQRAMRPMLGSNLLSLDLNTVVATLEQNPWVLAAEARKELPHRLRVRVIERPAAALLQDGEQLFYLDRRGMVIAPVGTTDPGIDLVVISRPPIPDAGAAPAPGAHRALDADRALDTARERRAALALVSELASARPDWAQQLSEIELLGMGDFRLFVASIPFPLLVRAGTLHGRIRRLEALVPQIAAHYGAIRAVDLRFARRIIVQPAETTAFMRS